jgi:hypothetical protein
MLVLYKNPDSELEYQFMAEGNTKAVIRVSGRYYARTCGN